MPHPRSRFRVANGEIYNRLSPGDILEPINGTNVYECLTKNVVVHGSVIRLHKSSFTDIGPFSAEVLQLIHNYQREHFGHSPSAILLSEKRRKDLMLSTSDKFSALRSNPEEQEKFRGYPIAVSKGVPDHYIKIV